jgi:hypothetical protein
LQLVVQCTLFALNSSLHVDGSNSYNKASFAGAMITSESSIKHQNIENSAVNNGGVVIACRSRLPHDSANSAVTVLMVSWPHLNRYLISPAALLLATVHAASHGGVMSTSNSSFNIISINNSAASHGGVMFTFDSPFNVISSTFTNNSACFSWWCHVHI